MCGIFAYLTHLRPRKRHDLIEILIQGLQRLSYRGYDSAGKAKNQKHSKMNEIITILGHSTFTVRSQKNIYSGYSWLSRQNKAKNVLHNKMFIFGA